MSDVRIQDSPYRASVLHYLTWVLGFALSSSVCITSIISSLYLSRSLDLIPGDFHLWHDLVIRLEVVVLFGAPSEATYLFMLLARCGLPINVQLVSAALLRSTRIYTFRAVVISGFWLLGLHYSGHNWWLLLWAYGGVSVANTVVRVFSALEPDAPVGGVGVLNMSHARRFL